MWDVLNIRNGLTFIAAIADCLHTMVKHDFSVYFRCFVVSFYLKKNTHKKMLFTFLYPWTHSCSRPNDKIAYTSHQHHNHRLLFVQTAHTRTLDAYTRIKKSFVNSYARYCFLIILYEIKLLLPALMWQKISHFARIAIVYSRILNRSNKFRLLNFIKLIWINPAYM